MIFDVAKNGERQKCEPLYHKYFHGILTKNRRKLHIGTSLHFYWNAFLVADTQLYKRLCPSVHPSVRPSVRWSVRHGDRVEQWKNERFGYILCMFVCGGGVDGVGVRMGVRCPCPPVRNDIVTPRHLFWFVSSSSPSFEFRTRNSIKGFVRPPVGPSVRRYVMI